MPIRYAIQPDLDLLLYIFEGECNGREYLHMYHSVYLDKRRHHGMKVIMDLLNTKLDFDTQSLQEAMAIVAENKAGGFPPDHVAILTKSTSMRFLKEALVVLADNIPMHLEVFHIFDDTVRWLGLGEKEKEARLFWEASLQARE